MSFPLNFEDLVSIGVDKLTLRTPVDYGPARSHYICPPSRAVSDTE